MASAARLALWWFVAHLLYLPTFLAIDVAPLPQGRESIVRSVKPAAGVDSAEESQVGTRMFEVKADGTTSAEAMDRMEKERAMMETMAKIDKERGIMETMQEMKMNGGDADDGVAGEEEEDDGDDGDDEDDEYDDGDDGEGKEDEASPFPSPSLRDDGDESKIEQEKKKRKNWFENEMTLHHGVGWKVLLEAKDKEKKMNLEEQIKKMEAMERAAATGSGVPEQENTRGPVVSEASLQQEKIGVQKGKIDENQHETASRKDSLREDKMDSEEKEADEVIPGETKEDADAKEKEKQEEDYKVDAAPPAKGAWALILTNHYCSAQAGKHLGADLSLLECKAKVTADPTCKGSFMYSNGRDCNCMRSGIVCAPEPSADGNAVYAKSGGENLDLPPFTGVSDDEGGVTDAHGRCKLGIYGDMPDAFTYTDAEGLFKLKCEELYNEPFCVAVVAELFQKKEGGHTFSEIPYSAFCNQTRRLVEASYEHQLQNGVRPQTGLDAALHNK